MVPELRDAGHTVRCLARNPDKLASEPWATDVEQATGDVLDPAGLDAALDQVDILYYLVHSLHDNEFADLDRRAAHNVAKAAEANGVKRIIYLGGLGDTTTELSPHLRSRAEVAEILLAAPTPATVLRAGLIIGSGGTSFEMLRHLAHRAPVLPNASWLDTRTQPIAVRDALYYLVRTATARQVVNRQYDIGGPEPLRYREMIQRFSRTTGLPGPFLLPTPGPPGRLNARLAGLMSPIGSNMAAQLVESLEHETVCTEHDIDAVAGEPPGGRLSFEDAVREATIGVLPSELRTGERNPAWPLPTDPPGSGGPVFTEERVLRSATAPSVIWDVLEGIGGEHGWYSLPLLWELRAGVEHLLGNENAVRGRTNPEQLRPGQDVDWWRVHSVRRGERVVFTSTLYTPGTVWLEMSVRPVSEEESEFRQRLFFTPRGTAGEAYWYAMKPMHDLTFEVMARNIVRTAERRGTLSTPLAAAASITAQAMRCTVANGLRLLNHRLPD